MWESRQKVSYPVINNPWSHVNGLFKNTENVYGSARGDFLRNPKLGYSYIRMSVNLPSNLAVRRKFFWRFFGWLGYILYVHKISPHKSCGTSCRRNRTRSCRPNRVKSVVKLFCFCYKLFCQLEFSYQNIGCVKQNLKHCRKVNKILLVGYSVIVV